MQPYQVLVTSMLALTLAGCGSRAPEVASRPGLKGVLSYDLFSVKGKTREDDRKIASTQEQGIRAGIWQRDAIPPVPKALTRPTS